MRNTNDRRHPQSTGQPPGSERDAVGIERRKNSDRRKENLTLEERQTLFSEMPSLKPPKSG